MSVYGTYGAFQGLGKPSIKLEFEDNEALLDFQRRMQNPDGGEIAWDAKEETFVPMEGYGDTYIVTDLRKRAKKEPGDTKAYNKAFDWKLEDRPDVAIKNFNKDLYELTKGLKWANEKETAIKDTNYKLVTLYQNSNNSGYDVSVPIFIPRTFNRKNNTFTGWYIDRKTPVDINQLQHYIIYNGHPVGYFTKDYFKKVFNNALIKELTELKKYKDNPDYTKERQNELNKEYKYFLQFYSNPSIYTPDMVGGGILRRYAVEYADINADGLGAPGDTYIITDTRTRARKDLEDTAALKKYDIRKFSGEELQRMQTDDPLLYEQIKSDLGKTANDALYNNLEILDFRGMQPTYRILSDYSQFFAAADNKSDFAGFGLNDTKKLIADTCRRYYKECEAIAKHLKADTVLQSCFNLWHWLHNNIRYEYDAAGKEEIRTPRRVWADRHRGVDCDCLSTFAWCVLKCMGYDPVFELAAFKNKPAFSHIYVVCDGVVVDRVWFVFNSRPPGITKREIYVVKNLQNLGQLF